MNALQASLRKRHKETAKLNSELEQAQARIRDLEQQLSQRLENVKRQTGKRIHGVRSLH